MADNSEKNRKKFLRFFEHIKRPEIISEVITDEFLMHPDLNNESTYKKYELCFILDYHQLSKLIFPTIISGMHSFSNKENHSVVMQMEANERSFIYYDRLVKSLPFFTTFECAPPILIPPYIIELDDAIKSGFARRYKETLVKYAKALNLQADEAKNEWIKARDRLISISVDPSANNYKDTIVNKIVSRLIEFSNRTAQCQYTLSIAHSSSNYFLSYLINNKHVIFLSDEELTSLNIDEIKNKAEEWHKILIDIHNKEYKDKAEYIDAFAVAYVEELNRIAIGNNINRIYFLLSDAPQMWILFKKICSKELSRYIPGFSKVETANYINYLRTSFHFEESMRAFKDNEDDNPNRTYNIVETLHERSITLSNSIKPVEGDFNEMMKKCNKYYYPDKNCHKCKDALQEDCNKWGLKIEEIIKIDNEISLLHNIINSKKFELLYNFIRDQKEIYKNIQNTLELRNLLYSFFFENTENDFRRRLKSFYLSKASDIFNSMYYDKSLDLYAVKLRSSDTHISAQSQMRRMNAILYDYVFKEKDIKELLEKVKDDSKDYVDLSRDKSVEWNLKLSETVMRHKNDLSRILLTIIIFYGFYFYQDVALIADTTLKLKRDEIEKEDKEFEFYFLYFSARARLLYELIKDNKEQHIASKVYTKIIELCKEIKDTLNNDDPRYGYLCGKIYAMVHQKGIKVDDNVMRKSYEYSKAALEIVQNNNIYKPLEIRLQNNMLWNIVNLQTPNDYEISKAEELAQILENHKTKSHYADTLATYYKFSAMKPLSKDLFIKAIELKKSALSAARREHINTGDIQDIEGTLSKWEIEFNKLFNKNS